MSRLAPHPDRKPRPPSVEAGAGYFDREYFELHGGKRRYLDYLIERLRGAGVTSGDVLDVGSGYGFFVGALAAAGYRPVGAELSPFAAGEARRRGVRWQVVATADSPLPFRDRSFDAVTMLDVIEHVAAWEEALAECARVLRPGGRLLVITLNRFSALRLLMGRRWSWYQDPTHVHMFSLATLRRGFAAAGLACARSATLLNFCSVGETTRWLRPLRRIGRVVHLPAVGDAILLEGVRRGEAPDRAPHP